MPNLYGDSDVVQWGCRREVEQPRLLPVVLTLNDSLATPTACQRQVVTNQHVVTISLRDVWPTGTVQMHLNIIIIIISEWPKQSLSEDRR